MNNLIRITVVGEETHRMRRAPRCHPVQWTATSSSPNAVAGNLVVAVVQRPDSSSSLGTVAGHLVVAVVQRPGSSLSPGSVAQSSPGAAAATAVKGTAGLQPRDGDWSGEVNPSPLVAESWAVGQVQKKATGPKEKVKKKGRSLGWNQLPRGAECRPASAYAVTSLVDRENQRKPTASSRSCARKPAAT